MAIGSVAESGLTGMRVYAVIPAFQPTDGLMELVATLGRAPFDGIVVVDDGSGAGHAGIFAALSHLAGVVVLRHVVNLGKGAALKTAINHVAAVDPAAGIVTLDADGQHTVASAVAVRAGLLAEP
jgi:glycosyltransferase involved in cell wall biosynthesis